MTRKGWRCDCSKQPSAFTLKNLAQINRLFDIGLVSVTDIPNFEQMSDLERLELADEILASVRNRDALPAPLAHRFELERRWAEYERDPSIGLSEQEFWSKVRALEA
jgi:putative addiction module component (TIGR02574 family)